MRLEKCSTITSGRQQEQRLLLASFRVGGSRSPTPPMSKAWVRRRGRGEAAGRSLNLLGVHAVARGKARRPRLRRQHQAATCAIHRLLSCRDRAARGLLRASRTNGETVAFSAPTMRRRRRVLRHVVGHSACRLLMIKWESCEAVLTQFSGVASRFSMLLCAQFTATSFSELAKDVGVWSTAILV